MAEPAPAPPLLAVRDLHTVFDTPAGALPAVAGLSFTLARGTTLGLVGESGCGKTMAALSLMGLVDPPGRVAGGSVKLAGEELLGLSEAGWRRYRGRQIAMIFQEPLTALNPVLSVGYQLLEPLRLHLRLNRRAATARAVELLDHVGFPDPAAALARYPHQLSGGLRQRVMIAMALAAGPALLIADEPTTALDMTIQAQILDLLRRLQASDGLALLLISHDLALVSALAQQVVVMYAGRMCEQGPPAALFATPQHPYTQGLVQAAPQFGPPRARLAAIPGTVPPLAALPRGCPFHPRCPHASDQCRLAAPPLVPTTPGRAVACWHPR